MKIKICGIKTIKEYLQCINNKIDYIGFNFYRKSKRYINYKKAKTILKAQHTHTSKIVGIFINPNITTLKKIISQTHIDLIQVNSNWQKHKTSVKHIPIIRCFNLTKLTYKIIKNITNTTTITIIDSHTQHRGGTGEKFNWNLIKKLNTLKTFIAGGININNSKYISKNFKPYGIDIASGSENENIKCLKKIKTLRKANE
ncbi:phosphoribosylanthranilate isomerase [Candidatus Vidania fulgoroideae]|uniref:N-(5'-phosphoribosyl)anthranilate isomerase n=1 Tax=Candidatus Vidania fulgoroideorum TaxID=881286 RepID=A0A974X931_9PROT|nr:phosphoribosylanthranilate isomerase [Candidatus Vidania fulgoroideae]